MLLDAQAHNKSGLRTRELRAPQPAALRSKTLEPTVRINLFKDGGLELWRALLDEKIPLYEKRSAPGSVMAAGQFIEVVTAVGGASLVPSIAFVLRQWLKNKASRRIIIQARDQTIIHAEGLSVEELEKAIELAESITAAQTKSDDSAP